MIAIGGSDDWTRSTGGMDGIGTRMHGCHERVAGLGEIIDSREDKCQMTGSTPTPHRIN